MKKSIHRAVCVFFCLIVLCACLPASAFAVDPVSAGVMANAFAQAIAAYGASNGVAMTFDVANTNGIGEQVHELWSDFRAGTQDADDYATLAAALFPNLYYKAANVVGAAADVYTVGYNINSTYAEEFDNFYNWLLSGPAEMTKVDNQYFQFSQAQIGPNSRPINVNSSYVGPWSGQPVPVRTNGITVEQSFTESYKFGQSSTYTYGVLSRSNYSRPIYVFICDQQLYCVSLFGDAEFNVYFAKTSDGSGVSAGGWTSLPTYDSLNGVYYGGWEHYQYPVITPLAPSYPTLAEGLAGAAAIVQDGVPSDSIGVKSYDNTGIASFPDTTDPNYEAVAKRIPSDIPWDDTMFGDGTGTLTDAQSGSIAAEADQVLAEDGALTLAGDQTDNPGPDDDDQPSSDPDDYLAVGLEDIFPFCIPFDIYNFLSALAAEPVAPHFTATLAFPQAIGGSQTIELDFDSPTWNQLAQLLRLLELLAFIVGLALLTRSMFIRG